MGFAKGMDQIICWSLPTQSTTDMIRFANTNLEISGGCLPSSSPSDKPSKLPSLNPSSIPSKSNHPSMIPSKLPSNKPPDAPSLLPSNYPSLSPSTHPSTLPSIHPSNKPSKTPSNPPSSPPSKSFAPTQSPTLWCRDAPFFRWNKKSGSKYNCVKWAGADLNRCKRSDKYKRLVRNYCLKTCNFCFHPLRCEDDPNFYFNTKKKDKYNCVNFAVSRSRCNKVDKKGRKVKEYCRGSCNFCAGKKW